MKSHHRFLLLAVAAPVLVAVAVAPGIADAAWRAAGVGGATLAAGTIGAAAAPTSSVVADQVTLHWEPVALLGPALLTDRATVLGYRIEGEGESGPFPLDASCTDTSSASCTTAQPIGETWRYVVVSALGGWTGPEGDPGPPLTVTPPPTATVTGPIGTLTAAGWDGACADGPGVCGTAEAASGGPAIVRVDVRVTAPDGRTLDDDDTWVEGDVWRTVFAADPGDPGAPAQVDWHLPLAAADVPQDGTTTIDIRVDDSAGWEAITATGGSVLLDRIAPVTTSDAPSDPQPGPTTITFSATDDGSGVATTESRTSTDGVTFTDWTVGTSVTLSAEATHTVQFRSTDVAGNVETPNSVTVTIEPSPPTVTLSGPADAVTVLSRQEVTLSASASHPSVAIESVRFSWSSNGSSWEDVGDPVTTPVDGLYTRTVTLPAGQLQWRATATRADGAEGTSGTRSITVRPEVTAVKLENTGTLGMAGPGDRIVITFSDVLDASSVCSAFTDPLGPSTATGLTLMFSGNPNVVSITAPGTCGTSGFGTIQVGSMGNGRYTQGNQTLAFSGSTLTWDPSTREIRITLGAGVSGTPTTGDAAIAVYSPGMLTSGGVATPAGPVPSSVEQRL